MTQTAQPKGSNARERLLALAEAAVLEKGFASTSIDELIAGAGITKSGFFYHFRDKSELAKALMQRYIDEHNGVLADIFRRADELNDDPLHGFLVALKLLAETMADLPGAHPGCLVASFVYQDQLLSPDVRALTVAGVQGWRCIFRQRLSAIAARHPPRMAVDLDDLADMANALVDGGIILSKLMRDREVLPRQIMLYRELVRTVFLGTR
jgi:AcrR family transcriptional regulator